MTNTEAIKILFHIANSLVEQYAPEEDKKVYNEAIEKAVDALLIERVSNLKANRKRRKL
jgi:hypothetical protein